MFLVFFYVKIHLQLERSCLETMAGCLAVFHSEVLFPGYAGQTFSKTYTTTRFVIACLGPASKSIEIYAIIIAFGCVVAVKRVFYKNNNNNNKKTHSHNLAGKVKGCIYLIINICL